MQSFGSLRNFFDAACAYAVLLYVRSMYLKWKPIIVFLRVTEKFSTMLATVESFFVMLRLDAFPNSANDHCRLRTHCCLVEKTSSFISQKSFVLTVWCAGPQYFYIESLQRKSDPEKLYSIWDMKYGWTVGKKNNHSYDCLVVYQI